MKKITRSKRRREPEMLDEYDFSKGVRGKYVERLKVGSNVIVLARDVAEGFPDSESANNALRALLKIARQVPPKRSA